MALKRVAPLDPHSPELGPVSSWSITGSERTDHARQRLAAAKSWQRAQRAVFLRLALTLFRLAAKPSIPQPLSLRAGAKQSRATERTSNRDCFVTPLLAITPTFGRKHQR